MVAGRGTLCRVEVLAATLPDAESVRAAVVALASAVDLHPSSHMTLIAPDRRVLGAWFVCMCTCVRACVWLCEGWVCVWSRFWLSFASLGTRRLGVSVSRVKPLASLPACLPVCLSLSQPSCPVFQTRTCPVLWLLDPWVRRGPTTHPVVARTRGCQWMLCHQPMATLLATWPRGGLAQRRRPPGSGPRCGLRLLEARLRVAGAAAAKGLGVSCHPWVGRQPEGFQRPPPHSLRRQAGVPQAHQQG
jgi:hypothetical protein